MKKTASIILLFAIFTFVEAKELFHFNFKDANNKSEIKSNNFTLKSPKVPLLVQQNALRLAATAEIEISGVLPDFRKGFTISAWTLRKRDIDICPILSSGMYRDGQAFVLNVGGEFFTRNKQYQISGIKTGNKIAKSGVWEHTVAVFNQGEYLFYRDGKLFAKAKGQMLKGDGPLYVGAEKEIRKNMNYVNADMLLNDLHFFDNPLTSNDVVKLYNKERKSYPTGSLIPKGKTIRHALELCFHYAPKGYDPDLKNPIYKKAVRPQDKPLKTSSIRSFGPDTAPALFINDKEHFPYMAYFLKNINHDRFEPEQCGKVAGDFAGAGVDLIRILVPAGGHPYSKWNWFGINKYDFTTCDLLIGNVLKNNPNAMLQILFHPNASVPWFRKHHPEEMEKSMLPNGKTYVPLSGGLLNSDVWKKATEHFLGSLIDHLESGPYKDRIYGYSLGGGASAEWYWPGTFSAGIPGYSKATEKLFQKWLKKRYSNDKALQKAWKDSKVTLEIAKVPLPKERQFSETLTLRNPQKAQKVLDLRLFFNDRVFELQRDFFKVAKTHSKNKKIVGTYSGYAFGNKPKHHLTGMNAAGRLLRLKECDYTQLAIYYGDHRQMGESGICVNPYNGSAMLHGKMLFNEADLRTPYTLNTEPYENANRHNTMEETASSIIRNFGNAITQNSGIYEMLLTGHTTYHHKTIMDAVAKVNKIGKNTVGKVRKTVAEVAVIHDEHSGDYFAWPNSKNLLFFNSLMGNFHYQSPKIGLPMDFYLMDDIANPKMKDYKLYIFLTAVSVPLDMQKAIHKKLAKNNATAVWFFAPGLINNNRFDTNNMERLTGIKFNVNMNTQKLQVKAVSGNSILAKCPDIREMHYGPVPVPVSPKQKVHATAAGKPAVVEVDTKYGKAFYSLLPPTRTMIRNLAKISNVHIYNDSKDVFNINSTHITIHAVTAGIKEIKLPGEYHIFNPENGKRLFSNTSILKIKMNQYESKIFGIEKCK